MKTYDFTNKTMASGSCLLWTGYVQSGGYGQVEVGGRMMLVHRLAWQQERGEIPPRMLVLHNCDNPLCIEISHLKLGTHKDNAADMIARERWGKTHRPHTRVRKLTDDQVREIRAADGKVTDIASKYGISHTTVCDIRNRKRKKLVPDTVA